MDLPLLRKEKLMKIMCINCSCQAGTIQLNIAVKIAECILEQVSLRQQPDVIILTEIVIGSNWPALKNYDLYIGSRNYYQYSQTKWKPANQVVIAVKKGTYRLIKEISYPYKPKPGKVFPDCHWIRIEVKGQRYSIIGFRMPSLGYTNQGKLFDDFVKYIESNRSHINAGEIVILAGDFNNGYCRGLLNKRFNSTDYKGKANISYNLNIIQDKLLKKGLFLIDEHNNLSWPYRDNWQLSTPYVPDDHIFISSGTGCKAIFYPRCLYDKTYFLDHRYFIANI